jgi:hypothetical protein
MFICDKLARMKQLLLAVALIIASSAAFADTTSVLLDSEKVRSMSAEEYAAAVSSAPDVNVRDEYGFLRHSPISSCLKLYH